MASPSLQEKLDAQSEKARQSYPAEALQIMQRATQELQESDPLDHMLGEGDTAPDFALQNIHGEVVSSRQRLEQGPMVVSFYRGVW